MKDMCLCVKYTVAAAHNLLLQEIFGEAISCFFIAGLKHLYSTAVAFTRCSHTMQVIQGEKELR